MDQTTNNFIKPLSILTNITAVLSSLLIVELAYPYGFPLITPMILIVFMFYLIQILINKWKIPISIEPALYYFLMLFFFLLGGLLTGQIYYYFLEDLKNCFVMILFFMIIKSIINNDKFYEYKELFIKYNVMFLFPVSLLCFYKFYKLLNGIRLDKFYYEDIGIYPFGTSLVPDYNMAALGLLIGSMSSFYLFRINKNFIQKTAFLCFSIVMILAALLTGSRRMYVVFVLIFIWLFLFWLIRIIGIVKRLVFTQRISRSMLLGALCALGLALLVFVAGGKAVQKMSGKIEFHQIETLIVRLEVLINPAEKLAESRGQHTERAIEMINNFSLIEIFIGDGFNYLEKMSSSGREDYPHNPIISGMLYGGILNAIIIILFIGRATYLYIKQSKNEKFFLLLYFVTFLFSIISSNSIFSNRPFLLLLVFPFLFRISRRYST